MGAALWLLRYPPSGKPIPMAPPAVVAPTNKTEGTSPGRRTAGRDAALPSSALWVRPAARVAEQRSRRCRLGSVLGALGANPAIVEHLAQADINSTLSQLKELAKAGDASAANQLSYLGHLTCRFAVAGDQRHDSEVLESNSLPPADRDWFRTVHDDDDAFNQQLAVACQQSLDMSEIDSWVTAAAARGDPASHYVLFMFGVINGQRHNEQELREAALGGYPWAQYHLAIKTTGNDPWGISSADPADHPVDLLRAAAQSMPDALDELARCEYTGCQGLPQDLPTAIRDARSAAEQGSMGPMLFIGPQLSASQIDPDEVRAWQLLDAALQLQGYQDNRLTVQRFKDASAVLNSPTVTAKAMALADQYWQQYRSRILAGSGCSA